MSWPFTPITTFVSKSVPKVTHTFLNSIQAAINAVFAPVLYRRASIYAESTDGVNVTLRVAALTALDETTNEYVFLQPASYTVTTTWPTSAWRYLYLVSTSGVASVEVSSTAPATPIAGPLYKSGDVTRRYLCAVRCDPGGSVVKFTMIDGRYLYFDTNLILSDTGTASWETLDMSPFVPPHVRRANLRVRVTNSAGSPDGPTFRSFSVGGIQLQADANSFDERDLFIATAGDTVEWNAAVTTDIVVLARGWEE
jgi:hypothetical protein